MAVQIFEIRWDGLFTIDKAKAHRIARGRGVYICYKTSGGKKTPTYIGKSTDLRRRLGDHRQGIARFSPEDITKATFALGEIFNHGGDRMSTIITKTQLGHIETFLINRVPNDNPNKPPYKGRDNNIVVNTGKALSLDSVIAHNPATFDLLSKGIRNKKPKQTKPRRDPLFYVGKI